MDVKNKENGEEIPIEILNKNSYLKENQDRLLTIWKNQLDIFSKIHTKHENKYSLYNHLLSIPVIIITSTLGFTSLTGIDPKIFNYVVSSLNFSCAILLALQKNLKFETYEAEHRQLAKKCAILSNDISFTIASSDLIKQEYILHIKNELDFIIDKSPSGLD